MKQIKILIAARDALKQTAEDLYALGIFEINRCEPTRMDLLASCLVNKPDSVIVEANSHSSLTGDELISAAVTITRSITKPLIFIFSNEKFTTSSPLPDNVYLLNGKSESSVAEEVLLRLFDSCQESFETGVDSRERLVYTATDELGFTANNVGMTYVADILKALLGGELDVNSSICKVIYPYIAKKHGVSAYSVERCIRRAISKSWEHIEPKYIHKYFGFSYNRETAPSNREYIMIVYDRLRRMVLLNEIDTPAGVK